MWNLRSRCSRTSRRRTTRPPVACWVCPGQRGAEPAAERDRRPREYIDSGVVGEHPHQTLDHPDDDEAEDEGWR